MLGLNLRKEFQGRRLKGTAIELTNRNNTGATQVAAAELLRITYPSGDVLKAVEAIGPQQGRPLVLIGGRGQGRRLAYTADHGYAASGRFPDVGDRDQVKYLKAQIKAGRYADDDGDQSAWVPPIDSVIESQHGRHRFVIGQRKWKAQGG